MKLLTAKQMAEILQVSERTFKRYIVKYCLPSYAGKRFKENEVLEALKVQPIQSVVMQRKVSKQGERKGNNQKYWDLLLS